MYGTGNVLNRIDREGRNNLFEGHCKLAVLSTGRLLGGLHPNTLRERKGGADHLTHVSGFGRRVPLIREEVGTLVELKITQSLTAERDQRKMLRLAG